jgi:hypothetical protein
VCREPLISARPSSPAAQQHSLIQQSTVCREPLISARTSPPAARQDSLIQQSAVCVQRARQINKKTRRRRRVASSRTKQINKSIQKQSGIIQQSAVCREPLISARPSLPAATQNSQPNSAVYPLCACRAERRAGRDIAPATSARALHHLKPSPPSRCRLGGRFRRSRGGQEEQREEHYKEKRVDTKL